VCNIGGVVEIEEVVLMKRMILMVKKLKKYWWRYEIKD